MSFPPPVNTESLGQVALHLTAGKYFQVAAFVLLVYDHMLTFSEEVERIWKQKITGPSILFMLNRYVTPLQFIIIIHAFNDPIWTPSACSRFVAFEGASTVALIAICELIMILRIYALYAKSTLILGSLMILWTLQLSISSIGMTVGFPVPLPPGFVGCIFTGRNKLFPTIWVTPLVTDSAIFLLTLWRTRDYVKRSREISAINIFLRDGLLYFLVIFMANLFNLLMFFLAADDLKAIGASFSQLITATMISRLVLNLRSSSAIPPRDVDASRTSTMKFTAQTTLKSKDTFMGAC